MPFSAQLLNSTAARSSVSKKTADVKSFPGRTSTGAGRTQFSAFVRATGVIA